LKKSSEVMPKSALGTLGIDGLPPVAINICYNKKIKNLK